VKAKRIPISAAAAIGKAHQQSQVIVVTWDPVNGLTHVVTWGKTKQDCANAAIGGNVVKQALGWPSALESLPTWLKDLKEEAAALHAENAALRETIQGLRVQQGLPVPSPVTRENPLPDDRRAYVSTGPHRPLMFPTSQKAD
jgi:hypothetical protein